MKSIITKYLIIVFTSIVSYITPIEPYIKIVGMAVLLDAFIAISLAIKKEGIVGFQSKRLKDTIVKTGIYVGSLLLTHELDLLYDMDIVMRVLFGAILLTELRSIDEKYFILYEKSLFKGIIDKLPNMNKQKDKQDEL